MVSNIMWIYDRVKQIFLREDSSIQLTGCYAGNGEGLNNPLMEAEHDIGPLPTNMYEMVQLINSPKTGVNTIVLNSMTHPFNRDGFRIHGDNKEMNFTASHGCIVTSLANRFKLWQSPDHVLKVI